MIFRSLLGHEDSITCVKFQPSTHYFFSSSKDGCVKYWDADRFV
jgi:U3 small nucleolar RNA-associated protein 12